MEGGARRPLALRFAVPAPRNRRAARPLGQDDHGLATFRLTAAHPGGGELNLDLSAASLVGGAAAVLSMASFTPQIVKIWRERDASSVSLRMYVVTVTGFTLWTIYGFMTGAAPVILANTVCLALSATVLALKWRFSRGDPARSGS